MVGRVASSVAVQNPVRTKDTGAKQKYLVVDCELADGDSESMEVSSKTKTQQVVVGKDTVSNL